MLPPCFPAVRKGGLRSNPDGYGPTATICGSCPNVRAAAPELCRKPAKVFLLAPRNNHERIITERSLELQRLLGRRRHPEIEIGRLRENDRHCLRMNCADYLVRVGSQEGEQIVCRLTLLYLSHRRPPRPDAGEECQRSAFVERKPHRWPRPVGQMLVLGKAGEGDETPVFDPEPSAPMRRADIANVGDARVCLLALQREQRRRHAPAGHREFSTAVLVANDGSLIVRENAWQDRQVTCPVAHGARQLADGLLALGDRVEIAHAASPSFEAAISSDGPCPPMASPCSIFQLLCSRCWTIADSHRSLSPLVDIAKRGEC